MSTHPLPEPLKMLVARLGKLPGLGPKSALRMAMALLKWPESETRGLGMAIAELRDTLHLCTLCNALTDTDPCSICSDTSRSRDTLCLVAEWDSMLTMEAGGFYKGQYMILGGLLAPLDNVNPETLELERLRKRLHQGEIQEIILGLGTTLEAENTTSYIHAMVHRDFPQVRITRLAQGIPLGSEVKFMDQETLRQSLRFRQNL